MATNRRNLILRAAASAVCIAPPSRVFGSTQLEFWRAVARRDSTLGTSQSTPTPEHPELDYPGTRVAQASNREALLRQAKANFVSALSELDEIEQNLDRRKIAHLILSSRLTGSEPVEFLEELKIEHGILQQLIQQNRLVVGIIRIASRLAGGEPLPTTFSEVSEKLGSVDQGLKQLQSALTENRSVRLTFRSRLNQIVEALMANPANPKSLVVINAELDPEGVDRDLQQQRIIISSVSVALGLLK